MTRSMHKTLVALNLPENAGELRASVGVILTSMTNNPDFPDPVPTLAEVKAALDAFHAGTIEAMTRAKGKATARDEKRDVLLDLLDRLRAYVQGVAAGDKDRKLAIIEGSGMHVKRMRAPEKLPFTVDEGNVSGSVVLRVRAAGKRVQYAWAWSKDKQSWTSAGVTMQAKTVIKGLPAGTTCWFRYRVTTSKGQGDWSEAVGSLVR
jgi:hypothetical protein